MEAVGKKEKDQEERKYPPTDLVEGLQRDAVHPGSLAKGRHLPLLQNSPLSANMEG